MMPSLPHTSPVPATSLTSDFVSTIVFQALPDPSSSALPSFKPLLEHQFLRVVVLGSRCHSNHMPMAAFFFLVKSRDALLPTRAFSGLLSNSLCCPFLLWCLDSSNPFSVKDSHAHPSHVYISTSSSTTCLSVHRRSSVLVLSRALLAQKIITPTSSPASDRDGLSLHKCTKTHKVLKQPSALSKC